MKTVPNLSAPSFPSFVLSTAMACSYSASSSSSSENPLLHRTVRRIGFSASILLLLLSTVSALIPPSAPIPRFREAPAFRNGRECPPSAGAPATEEKELCDPDSVHIAMTLDANYLRGTVAAIFSTVKHAACPENLAFHLLAASEGEGGGVAELGRAIGETFPYLRYKVYGFDAGKVKGKISASVREALEEPLNYARAYVGEIVPGCVGRVIYLDSDVLVVDDIGKLWRTEMGEGRAVAAPEYCEANYRRYFREEFWEDEGLREEAGAEEAAEEGESAAADGRRRNSKKKKKEPCYFNTGVMVMELQRWREGKYRERIERWMMVQKEEKRIYELGSLPPFLLVFGGNVEAVERRWNQHGLGGDNVYGRCRDLHPGPVSLLHWSGRGKPWLRLDSSSPCPLDALWAPYDLLLRRPLPP